MIFNSLEFIFFLPIVLILFYTIQHKFRIFILLIASYYFYLSWNPIYIILIFISTLTDYYAGNLLSKFDKKLHRKLILYGSMFINLGTLIYFKYSNFILENINTLGSVYNTSYQPIELLNIVLPVGISFYTFQTMSYTIDVYFKKIPAEKKLSVFALYVCFFPQLVAGPIERFSNLAPQLTNKIQFNKENFVYGLRLILYGFFLKMVVADNIASFVDQHYATIEDTHSLTLLLTAILYSFQIYCDFHGYSTIAIGTARLFNINLSQNFKAPYFSYSFTTFWRKWHISLTTWFRDYIYYPMGGNRQTNFKFGIALMVVFITSGIWHGAKWTFLIWGILHGIIVLAEKIFNINQKRKHFITNFSQSLIIFLGVTLLWILFRSPNLDTAIQFYTKLITNWDLDLQLPSLELCLIIVFLILSDLFTKEDNFAIQISKIPLVFRWSIYSFFIFMIMGRSGTDLQPFIYFQF